MMNDRFSAELRQHMLDTANERPGDGRLAAIVEGVAVTDQRHPLVTRLRWDRTGLDLFPSRAMRFGLIVAALIVAVVGAALFAVGQARRTPFEGTWSSTDPADGSAQTLVVSAPGWDRLVGRVSAALAAYHRQYALRRGMPKEELRLGQANGVGSPM